MIQCTVTCHKCKDSQAPETASFNIRADSQLTEQLRRVKFKWVEKPSGGKVLLGPLCRKLLKETEDEAAETERETINDFFGSERTPRS